MLVDPIKTAGAEDGLIRALFGALPPPGSVWTAASRQRWLEAAASIFDLVYRLPTEE